MFKMPKQTNWIEYDGPLRDLGEMIPRPSAWTGEGLPPVGIDFEWRYGESEWKIGQALYIGSVYVIMKARDGEQHYYLRDMEFRPIRTPEQIVTEERERVVEDLREIITADNLKGFGITMQLRAVYDAGYRKFEIVEGE